MTELGSTMGSNLVCLFCLKWNAEMNSVEQDRCADYGRTLFHRIDFVQIRVLWRLDLWRRGADLVVRIPVTTY
jgi:hypothetical protein